MMRGLSLPPPPSFLQPSIRLSLPTQGYRLYTRDPCRLHTFRTLPPTASKSFYTEKLSLQQPPPPCYTAVRLSSTRDRQQQIPLSTHSPSSEHPTALLPPSPTLRIPLIRRVPDRLPIYLRLPSARQLQTF
ncbi:hypothetical protein ABKN59_011439 [Abortiporus biennis]